MEQNPYKSPAHQGPASHRPEVEAKRPSVVRKGIPLAIAVAWNGPLLILLYFGIAGSISEKTMNLLIAAWASMIPIGSLLVAYVPALQRFIFVADFDIAKDRLSLWGLSILWILIIGLAVGFEWFRS